jgi:hypothetical protein
MTRPRCADGDRAAGERACRSGAERHGQSWLDEVQFLIQPPFAGFDLARVRLLVQPLLAARLELEVLHGVGDADARTIDAGVREGTIENLAGRTDEGAALQILLIARLLADQYHRCMGWPLAEHGLGGEPVQRTASAILCIFNEAGQRTACGHAWKQDRGAYVPARAAAA